MALPMKKIRINKVKNIIQYKTNPQKAPGYDLITGKILQELSQKGLRAVTQICNAILRIEYFPCQWKVGQIIMIAKLGTNPADITSYRPISLLQILYKILEKILLRFGFRTKHRTIEQAHISQQNQRLGKQTLLFSGLHGHKSSL
jgi:hypothetical protein